LQEFTQLTGIKLLILHFLEIFASLVHDVCIVLIGRDFNYFCLVPISRGGGKCPFCPPPADAHAGSNSTLSRHYMMWLLISTKACSLASLTCAFLQDNEGNIYPYLETILSTFRLHAWNQTEWEWPSSGNIYSSWRTS